MSDWGARLDDPSPARDALPPAVDASPLPAPLPAAPVERATVARPEGFDQIRGDALRESFQRARWSKLLLLEPAFFAVAGWAVYDAHESWRRGVAALGLLLIVALHLLQPRLRPKLAVCLRWVVGALLVGITGGLRSPLYPMLLIIVLAAPTLFEVRHARLTAALAVAFTWLMAALGLCNGRLLAGPRVPVGATLLYAACMTSLVLAAMAIGRSLRSASDAMLVRSLQARDETLRVHKERLRELTLFSAEIAHELKNPLATIKGLAALMKLDPTDAAERLDVLSGEVTRMQGVLEEFLNFSRPLTPLVLDRIDLRALVLDAVDLHAGMARDKALTFDTRAVAAEPVLARVDPRKLQQVLVNLLQNAIDASFVRGTIAVELACDGRRVHLAILDRGPGVPDATLVALFEPGVTSKPKGSGLGLTIVRALVEQHAGSITLRNRDGGGLAAEIELATDCERKR